MPWADSLRPIFEAKDGGQVRLFTSSMTLVELLARVDPADESVMLSAVRQYFELVPVDDAIGIHAAGIRRASNISGAASPPVKTPDAVEMATANSTHSLLFITNDEQLTRMPQTVKALYLKELALDWIEDEFSACISASVAAAIPESIHQRLELGFRRDVAQDWMVLESAMNADAFVRNAMMLNALIKGPCAVIGSAQGPSGGAMEVVALRVLPAGRPWITPPVPDWLRQFTHKKHHWDEPSQAPFVQRLGQGLGLEKGSENRDEGEERARPFIVVNTSRLDAEAEVGLLGNSDMQPHKTRQEIWRRYLAPFKPVMPLLDLPGARLWKAEAQNAHELDVAAFRRLFACAENVIGKEGAK